MSQQDQQAAAPAKKRRKWPWIVAGVIVLLIVIVSVSNNGSKEDGGAKKTTEGTPQGAPDTPAGPSNVIDKEGTFIVGTDIVPGRYRTTGGDDCYWERDRDLKGGIDSIIDNGGISGGQQVIEIVPSDVAFKTHGCGTWTSVSEEAPGSEPGAAPPASPANAIDKEGTFIIGKDIVPGRYRTAGGDDCYWERDKDLKGGIDSIIDNGGISGGQQVIEILPSDVAFKTHGCGTWTLVSQ
jgi:hypothetical protein